MAFDFAQAAGYELSSRTEALNKIDAAFDRALDREDRIIGHQMKEIALAEAERRHTNALREDALNEEARLQRDAFVQTGLENMRNLDPESDTFIEDYTDLVTSMPTGAMSAPQFDIMSKSLLQRNRDWMRNQARIEQAKVKRNDDLMKQVLPSLDDLERLDFMDRVSSGVPLDDAIDSAMGSVYNRKFGEAGAELKGYGFSDEFIGGISESFVDASPSQKVGILKYMDNLSKFEKGTKEYNEGITKIAEAEVKSLKSVYDVAKDVYSSVSKSIEETNRAINKAEKRGEDTSELNSSLQSQTATLAQASRDMDSAGRKYREANESLDAVRGKEYSNAEIRANLQSQDKFTKAQARWKLLQLQGKAGDKPTESQLNDYPELEVFKDGLENPTSVQSGIEGYDPGNE